MTNLESFVRESNLIEGITRPPTDNEIEAHERLLAQDEITVEVLQAFVSQIQHGAELRDKPGLNVRVGNHRPPVGGPKIRTRLETLLEYVNNSDYLDAFNNCYEVHHDYEYIHPFTDGNGRSGRALWLWQRKGNARLNFLHTFYYQALQAKRTGNF